MQELILRKYQLLQHALISIHCIHENAEGIFKRGIYKNHIAKEIRSASVGGNRGWEFRFIKLVNDDKFIIVYIKIEQQQY